MLGIILLGAPGAGKGTQAKYISQEFNIPSIATGDMLRSAVVSGSEIGLQVKAIMASGSLVADDIVIALVKERLLNPDCNNGYLFDGFPRTLAQAQSLMQAKVVINHVFEINTPEAVIVERLSGRRIHLQSGRTYHIIYNPPKVVGRDDITGEPLVQRDDDKEETIKHRLQVYNTQKSELVNYYQKLEGMHYSRLDGTKSADELKAQIFAVLQL